jgi:hypothetical protein
MDEKGFITVTEGRFTTYLDEMLPITFGLNYSEKLWANLKIWLNMVPTWMDEKLSSTVTEGRFTTSLDEMLPIRFG